LIVEGLVLRIADLEVDQRSFVARPSRVSIR
jgi:hypothetical protein